MKKYLLISILLKTLIASCIAQGYEDTVLWKSRMNPILVDSNTKIKYILDSSRTTVTAFKKNGKILWKTNPQKDNNFEIILSKPIIIYFYFRRDQYTGNNEQIIIEYQNTFTGFLNKKTGKFTFLGQD